MSDRPVERPTVIPEDNPVIEVPPVIDDDDDDVVIRDAPVPDSEPLEVDGDDARTDDDARIDDA